MTRAIVWKELREQAAVVTALVVLGCGLMAAMAVLLDPQEVGRGLERRSFGTAGVAGAVMLALAAGLVVGATLFAGEREAGTYLFLDRLPGTRWAVWWRKAAAGSLLAAVPAAGFFLASRLSGLIIGPDANGQAALLFAAVTLYGYAWGVFGSAWMRTSLGAAGVGLAAGLVAAVVLFLGLNLLQSVADAVFSGELRQLLRELFQSYAGGVWAVALAALPFAASAALYTAPDRDRSIGGVVRLPTPSGEMRTLRLRWPKLRLGSFGPLRSATRLGWLLWRQHRVMAAWLAAVALLAGFGLLIPNAVFLAAWPPLGLALGVLLAVTLFADEQGGDARRFWGERRLRVGRLWLGKLAFAVALLAPLLVLAFLPSGVRASVQRTPVAFGMLGDRDFPALGLLLLGPAYGLAFGHLAALLFRKPIVAGAVGLMVGGMAGALLLPPLLSGGVRGWQLWTPPLVVLLTGRLVVWPWATDRVAARPSLRRVGLGLTAAAALLAAGVGWRLVEVPVDPRADADIAFAKSLPSFDEKQGGRDVRRAVSLFTANVPYYREEGRAPGVLDSYAMFFRLLDASGNPAARPDFDDFLDRFGDDWEAGLEDAAAKPTGVFIDPVEFNLGTFRAAEQSLRTFDDLAKVYALRGLRAQRDGDPADFPRRLRVLLAAVNTTRTSGPFLAANTASDVENFSLQALDRWLARLRGRPELLREVLATLTAHDAAVTTGYDPVNNFYAEQTILRNSLDTPSQWMPRYLGGDNSRSSDANPEQTHADVVGFLWSVPWERARLLRAIGANNARPVAGAGDLAGVPGLSMMAWRANAQRRRAADAKPLVFAAVRGRLLVVACRLFQAERGRFPKALTELVPGTLAALPADPFAAAGPMGYRIAAAAEAILVEPSLPVAVSIPGDPLGMLGGTDFAEPAADADRLPAATAVAALAGSVVFRNAPEPLVNPDGTAADVTWVLPSPFPSQRQVPQALPVVAGQPVVWSVGPDRNNNGGLLHNSTEPINRVTVLGDLVYPVPLPAAAR